MTQGSVTASTLAEQCGLDIKEFVSVASLYGCNITSPDDEISAHFCNLIISGTDEGNSFVRPQITAALAVGVDPEFFSLSAPIFGEWWVTGPRQMIQRISADKRIEWFANMGLVAVLQEHSFAFTHGAFASVDGSSDSTLSDARQEVAYDLQYTADVERIRTLILENKSVLNGLNWKLSVAEILRLLWESPQAMKVVKKRGIHVRAIESALNLFPGKADKRPDAFDIVARSFSELARFHKSRTVWMWIETAPSGMELLVPMTRTQKKSTSSPHPQTDRHSYSPGEIVWVAMEENNNGIRSNKKHPALLLQLTGHRNDKWMVLSFTSDADSEREMRRIRDPEELGLQKGGFVWTEVQKVYHTQLENHIGWVTRSLLDVANRVVHIRSSTLEDLRMVADLNHPGKGGGN